MPDPSRPDTPRNRGDYDAPHSSPATPEEDARTILINQVSWGAILAGVVVGLIAQILLNMVGIGVGAATLDPVSGDNPSATAFSATAGIWFAVSGVLAALAGGYAAGRLAGVPKPSTTAWHGLIAWALTTLLVLYLLTSAIGGILGGAYRTLGSVLGGIASTAGTTAQTAAQIAGPRVADPFSSIEQTLRSESGGADPAALRDAAVAAVRAAVTGDQQQAQQARETAAQSVARAQNISIEQARTKVQEYEQQYRAAVDQAKARATELAETTRATVSRAALFGALSLILGAIAGWFGGWMGAVRPTLTGFGHFSSRTPSARASVQS